MLSIKTLSRIPIMILVLLCTSLYSVAQISSPNLIQDEVITISGVTTDAQIYGLTNSQKLTSHKFLDGLGRPIQSIAVQASPSQKDIIGFSVYNALGQQLTNYLPYVGADGSGNFHTTPTTDQSSYYSNGLSDKVVDDASPFSQQVIENSPLQRIINAGMNGVLFQPGTGHYKTINSRSNNSSAYTNDSYNTGIRQWNYDGTSSAVYPTGSLSVTEFTDESGNVTIGYKDAVGRTILKRQIISAQVIDGQTENCLDTYYIYDDAGELLYIVPPKALVAIRTANASPWNVTLPAAGLLTYQFIYDSMGRLTEKKVPGADWIYIVYDVMNRPVLLQDGNLRANNNWHYFKYDIVERVISEGIYKDAVNGTSLSSMQTYVSSLSSSYTTYYYEEKQTSGTSPNFYTNRIFPTTNQNGTALQDLLYSYYDNYDFNGDGTADYSYQVQGLSNEASPTALTRGLPTGIFKKTINNDGTLNVWVMNITFFDKRGNTIQVLSNNHTNISAMDTRTYVLDFVGKILQSKAIKTVNSVATTVSNIFTYDSYNRINTIDQSNNGGISVRVAAFLYNELGQLVARRLHSTDNNNFLQKVDYRYNINGLMTSINNATLTVDNTHYTNDDANDLFGMNILYETVDVNLGNTAQYNGNISGAEWKALPPAPANSNERSYTYSYDQLNRLKNAHYAEWSTTGSSWTNAVGYNDENVTGYDHNGNIEGLTRNSLNTSIDQLSYSYNGNQLTNVSDASSNASGFNGTNTSPYVYDNGVAGNGNLTGDPKKGITISYNIMNLTDKILFTSSNNYIRYTYDMGGSVIRKEVYTNSTSTTITYDYIDGFVYQNNTLSYFPTAEGRVRNGSGILTFEYFIRDNLGNVRVSFDGTGSTAVVKQENSYYPFGMTLPGNYVISQPNNNLFNGGSEWQNDFGNLPDFYQAGVRNYDAEIGRFVAVDKLAHVTSSLSPYQFAGNNPIGFNDPSGLLLKSPPPDSYPSTPNKPFSFSDIFGLLPGLDNEAFSSSPHGDGNENSQSGQGGANGETSAIIWGLESNGGGIWHNNGNGTGNFLFFDDGAIANLASGVNNLGNPVMRVSYSYLEDDGSKEHMASYVNGLTLFTINGPKICRNVFQFAASPNGDNAFRNSKVWGIIAMYEGDTHFLSLVFGENIYAPITIKNWSFLHKLASEFEYHSLWSDGDIEELKGGKYRFSRYANAIISADATDYASYWTSLGVKNSTITTSSTYKTAFSVFFYQWTSQYMPGTTMNILNSNVPGTTMSKLTDGDPYKCQ